MTRGRRTITSELLGTPSEQIRGNLSGDQPKLYEPWITMDGGAVTE